MSLSSHAQTASPSARRVVVVGGGLAGIAAAVRLAGHGLAVTLVETRKRLGGRATSFVDPATGRVLDNCQHVLLGCCTNLIDLYRRLGVADKIEWHRRLYFIDGHGHLDTLEGDDLAAPLHMTRSLLAFKGLTLGEKLAISRGMLAAMRSEGWNGSGNAALNQITFLDWLKQQRQPQGAIDKFWSTIVISAINETPARMAADYALQVFREGFLAHNDAYVMGVAAVPLVQLYDAAERVIERAGGRVLLGTSAERFEFDPAGRRITALAIDGAPGAGGDEHRLEADAFIGALPFDRLAKVATAEMIDADPRLGKLDVIDVSPIVGIHLFFDDEQSARPVMKLPHLIFTESPLQWVFNKGHDAEVGGQHLHGVISAAHDLVDLPADSIADMAVAECRRLIPGDAIKRARLLHAKVIKEKRATFSAGPGFEAMRPSAKPQAGAGAMNLYLAGDWVKTGWPAMMEGATRSGYLAAAARLGDLHDPIEPLVADLKPSWLYGMIAR